MYLVLEIGQDMADKTLLYLSHARLLTCLDLVHQPTSERVRLFSLLEQQIFVWLRDKTGIVS
ncbi:hypothetical protein N7495_004767 [Penicillium taxi]|uniref:uncharacterized protein n=1 Tax=Penicillium taxi TaxID=168475 RepID=UPI002544D7C1|nr:uncharacterized protein N7495_004767 [Penicillium taxi]KAJ5900023.1 hypothetical protein N7495_004767 [Penicillium taxi]